MIIKNGIMRSEPAKPTRWTHAHYFSSRRSGKVRHTLTLTKGAGLSGESLNIEVSGKNAARSKAKEYGCICHNF